MGNGVYSFRLECHNRINLDSEHLLSLSYVSGDQFGNLIGYTCVQAKRPNSHWIR